MRNEKIIWSNVHLNIEDYKDYLDEFYQDVSDEDEQYRIIWDYNYEILDDERMNLDRDIDGDIIIIADLGLWYGRRSGYKIIENASIADCLNFFDGDYAEWYIDDKHDLRCDEHHHDGCNHYLYRIIKNDLSETVVGNFINKLCNGNLTRRDITDKTISVGKIVESIYGWR